ncbi:uncharacterized protein LOC127737718 [Mytilus californianus]|uniref:uncharacterized protein LOC127737718 n=1 Tax=Mytilus californianus TaxID=6549 RepID=UPI0022457B3D|nr:uncharacterized protein LOC127737718 [Mytilus californianus]XP_052104548.1 uncharacterized protein LOC127737718 [Mytilus californianus]XP_052104555.1 uncharacterized protein LOC127737718 [Mytilus californianus]XP_052104561.1 uncharacterized protein LOC127737718 [Mytilus californianus]XP_052104571.1 uncharacterized protein LOC127737718 [Mytilus californianus]XP_052104580.1 uncharacterized protein LOC127737718 [Mytilus californianus]XP_052104589.1 uncharacterized protein LOC127737718 [Mytilu
MLGIVLSITSMVLYLAETGLNIHLCITRITSDFTSSVIILSLTAGPLVLVNVISTILVLRTMDFSGRGCARTICILLHFLQVGLIWRCLKLLLLFDEHDWREFIILRLIHTAMQSFPILILKGSHFFSGHDTTSEVITVVIVGVIANAVVFSMYNTQKFLFENDDFSQLGVRIRKPFGILMLTFGTIFLMASRCGSIMLFQAVIPLWLPLPIGFHFLVYLFSTTIFPFCNNKGSILQVFKNICLSYFNIFDIFNKEKQKIICVNVLLYSGLLVENVIMTGFWMMNNNWDYKYQLGTTVSIILTFVCGMFLKCCSCSYLQNETFKPFSDATYQLALEIAMKNTSHDFSVKHGIEIQNHEQYGENHCSIISLQNGYIHKVPHSINGNSKNGTSEKLKGEISSEKDESTPSRKKRRKHSSNVDLASSNSRNTNTLNVSDPSNVFCHINNSNLQNAQTMPCLTVKRRPELSVRTSDRKPNNSETKRSFCKSPPKSRKSPLPLFPNECSDFVSNKTFESKHVLSNSVEEYNVGGSDTSYSVSYSYYADSSDWSSMSCDSSSAMTWPPSNPISFINLHCLPKDKISPTDSVQHWLTQLDEWEQSIENDSFDISSKDRNSSPVPSSEYTDKSQSSRYKNVLIGTQANRHTPALTNRESDILLRPKDALLQFRESKPLSYLPYDPSDYKKTQQLANENTIVIWHERDTTPTNTVQESMV